jgi:hypothetical protein
MSLIGRGVVLGVDGSSGDERLEHEMAGLLSELFEPFKKKRASYGPGDIAAFGEKGCLIRGYDKMQRLKRLIWDQEPNPLEDETVEDALMDEADYSLITILVRRGEWPGLREEDLVTRPLSTLKVIGT